MTPASSDVPRPSCESARRGGLTATSPWLRATLATGDLGDLTVVDVPVASRWAAARATLSDRPREAAHSNVEGYRDDGLYSSIDTGGGRAAALRERVPDDWQVRRRRVDRRRDRARPRRHLGWGRSLRRRGRRRVRVPQSGRALLRRGPLRVLDADVPMLPRRVDRVLRRPMSAGPRRRPAELRCVSAGAGLSVHRRRAERVQFRPTTVGVRRRRLDVELDARVLLVAARRSSR